MNMSYRWGKETNKTFLMEKQNTWDLGVLGFNFLMTFCVTLK